MRPELESTLLHCRNLPSPPGVALQIIDLAQNPNATLADVAHIVGMDPALSARLLRMANSPLYATRRRAGTLAQAMTTLGVNATLSLALGFSLMQGLRGSHGSAELQERLWRRSVLAGLAARILGQHAGVTRTDTLMLAGLLQDMGRLALLQALTDGYASLCAKANGNDALLVLERAYYGSDHAKIGAWLAARWNLPGYLVDAIAHSEDEHPAEDLLQRCVQASGAIADLWLAGERPADVLVELAQARVAACTDEGGPGLDALLPEIAASVPEIATVFDVHIDNPAHLQSIGEHARELLILRNLRQIQEMAQTRDEAHAIEERMRQLTEQSRRDPLTGVHNRLHMEESLERAFTIAGHHSPLALALIDIDDFKQINDGHGHLVGDQVLRQFALSLQGSLRASDLLARYGGEEFLLVLPYSDEDAAVVVLQRLLAEVARLPMAVVEGRPIHVTFSAGVAVQNGGHARFDNVVAMLQAADGALYAAKRGGRNRVHLHRG